MARKTEPQNAPGTITVQCGKAIPLTNLDPEYIEQFNILVGNVQWCIDEIELLRKSVCDLQSQQQEVVIIEQPQRPDVIIRDNAPLPPNKPWYTSKAIWFVLLLVAGLGYMIYLFYMNTQGYGVNIPFLGRF